MQFDRSPVQKSVPQAFKVQQWDFPSDNRGLVQVRRAVFDLRRVESALGHLGVSHLALALPQLGHVALEAQAELRVLPPRRFQPPLLQVYPLHVPHLLGRRRAARPGLGVGAWVCASLCARRKRRRGARFERS